MRLCSDATLNAFFHANPKSLNQENPLWQIDHYYDILPKNIRGAVKKLSSSAAFLKQPLGEKCEEAYDCFRKISSSPKTDFPKKEISNIRSNPDQNDWNDFSEFL